MVTMDTATIKVLHSSYYYDYYEGGGVIEWLRRWTGDGGFESRFRQKPTPLSLGVRGELLSV